MAVRPLQPQDGGVIERRLRPIYDWLDNGNNKKALQEAEKVLKKAPSLQAAKALKALALFRLEKGPEAQVVLDALAEEKPSDDATLQAMTISYRESQQMHKVCDLYENAVKAAPCEELYTHLFMSYVRVGDYKSQRRTAMALYKIVPKSPYYCWAVMSIVLQAKSEDSTKQRDILLALTQRMVEIYMAEDKMEAEQETRLYIMILELQERWDEIIKFLDSTRYAQIVPSSIPQALIPYLKKVGHWKRLNILCKDLLYHENADRWDYYMPYFDSVFELMKAEPDPDSTADDTPEKCHEFLCQLVESMSLGKLIRGPYLARLELWKRLSDASVDPASILGSGVALCIQYLRVFAHKPCALPDLRPYLPMLPMQERQEKSKEFLTCLDFHEDSEPTTQYDVQRHISCLSLWRVTAPPLPPEGNLALAHKLRDHYLRSLQNGLVDATPTEFCAADGYGVLAAHHYFYAAVEKEDTAPLIEALGLLELVLHHSSSNFHVKLLLVKLYHMLGNALAADTIYQKLEIKHIQLVSLGWMHAARLAPSCASSKALQLLADTRTFHSHQYKDSAEHLTYAYRYGTFEKLVELGNWSSRIEACAWGASAGRERALLALLAGPPQPLHAPSALNTTPTDNRDLNVIISYEPPELLDPQLKSRTFDQDVAYLRLKDGLVSALALCIELADQRPLSEKQPQFEELQTCVEAFSVAMHKCAELYCVKERIGISEPFPSRIIALVSSEVPYRELYARALLMAGAYCAGRHAQAHAACAAAAALLAGARARLPTLTLTLTLTLTDTDALHLREGLEHLANYLEFIGIVTFLLGVCNEITAPTNLKKSKRKVTKSSDEIKSVELLSKLNRIVQNNIDSLETVFDNLPLHTCALEDEFQKLSVNSKFINPVERKLNQGRLDMIADVKTILKNKSKYLKSLIH